MSKQGVLYRVAFFMRQDFDVTRAHDSQDGERYQIQKINSLIGTYRREADIDLWCLVVLWLAACFDTAVSGWIQ